MLPSRSYDNGYLNNNGSSLEVTAEAPLSEGAYIAIGVYLVVLWVMAFCGNVTVLLVLLCQKTALRKLQNILLLNMASADLLVTFTAYPLTAVSSFHQRWLFGDLTCRAGGFLVFMFTMVSMDTLTAIAVFRYILVCQPKYHHLLKGNIARRVVLGTWVHSGVWTSLPLLGWSRYVPEPFLTSCTLDWTCEHSPGEGSGGDLAYIVLTLLTCYLLHVILIVFCYARILGRSRRLTFGARDNSSLVKLEEVLWHHRVETEKGVTKMCAVMVVAFLLCWTPYAVMSVLAVAGMQVSATLSTLPTMFAKLSCALNPFIYVLLCSKFRHTLHTSLTPRPHPHPHPQHRCENRVLGPDAAATGGGIEMPVWGESKPGCGRDPVEMREYRGDMTNQGVYIGNVAVSLEVQSTVF